MGRRVIRHPSISKRTNRGDDIHQTGMRHERIKKQKINATGSTISELVGVHEASPQVLWTKAFLQNQGFKVNKATLYQYNMSKMLTEKNGRASSSSQTKHIKIRYFFIQDRIEKEDIGLEYCHTENMVADFMKKTLQGEKFFEFRYRIMGMSNGENITEMRKVRDEIAQNEDTQNGQTARGLESKQFEQESSVFVSKITEPEGVCWKSEENVYRFEVLRDEEDVIE